MALALGQHGAVHPGTGCEGACLQPCGAAGPHTAAFCCLFCSLTINVWQTHCHVPSPLKTLYNLIIFFLTQFNCIPHQPENSTCLAESHQNTYCSAGGLQGSATVWGQK